MARSGQHSPRSCLMFILVLIMASGGNVDAMPCATMTSEAGSRVQCSHHRMTRFPAHVPDDVTWLDMSFNFLTSLDALKHPRFFHLQHLFVSHNSLRNLSENVFKTMPNLKTLDLGYNALGTLHSDVFNGLTNLTTLVLSSTGLHFVPDTIFISLTHLLSLELSGNSLSSVPTTSLQYVSNLQYLYLSGNALTRIDNGSLCFLSNLQYLGLESNQLTSLQPAAFDGLEKLVTLDLQRNQLGFSYPQEVFSPLVSLETLLVADNNQDLEIQQGEFPRNVFDSLRVLKTLSIDSFDRPQFGKEFANMNALQTLDLREGCQIHHIQNNTYSAFRNSVLQTLTMHRCPLMNVDTCAFCHLPHLTRLSMRSLVYLKLSSLLLALYGVQNQTFEEVDFTNTGENRGPVVLHKTMTLYLNNVCIKRLSLRQCCLTEISSRAFEKHGKLFQCLEHLDLSWNYIFYGKAATQFMSLFNGLVNLESVRFDKQQIFTRGSNVHRHQKSETLDHPKHEDITFLFKTAASLRYVNFSGSVYDIDEVQWHIHFPDGGNLSVLDLSYSGVIGCNFNISGLTSIHTFDISGNDCYIMEDWFFQYMTTLRRLMLSNVYLNEQFLFTNGSRMLKPLGDLEELDLSENQLRNLPADLLQHQVKLKRLVLARNQLESIPSALSQLKTLQEIDLSDNMIHILSHSDRQLLDNLAAQAHTFTFRLRGNPLSCACPSLDMVAWLAVTTVRLDGVNSNDGFDEDYDDNGRDYPCALDNGSMSSVWSVKSQWESQWRTCIGLSIFTVSVIGQLIQLLALVVTYVLWSKWTYIKHKWYVLRHVKMPRRVDFTYDVLLVYASDDLHRAHRMKQNMLRVMPHLHVVLPEDVIPAGAFYSDEIADCIERSWKIILLVTQDFVQDDMSGYTVLHAQGSLSDTMPRRVILLYEGRLAPGGGDNPAHLSMRRLLRTLPRSNVYHVPNSIEDYPAHPVWCALSQAVLEE